MNEANFLNINIFKIQFRFCSSASHKKEENLELDYHSGPIVIISLKYA